MALFDRNDGRGYGYRGDPNRNRGGGFLDRVQSAFRGQDSHVSDEHLRRDYENRSAMDTGTGYGRGWNAAGTGYGRPMDREGGLHQRNSWSDGGWTADAAERTDREWNLQNRGRYDSDTSPFQAGWRAGGMHGGGMGMNRGTPRGLDDDRGWNLGSGDREWGHTGNLGSGTNRYDRGWTAGGSHRGGGFLDRAQNAVRRGWDNLEDRVDRDDDRNGMHLGGGAMRGGSSWAGRYDRDWHQPSDLRGYRDGENHYGVTHAGGMMGGGAGLNRYGSDYDRDMTLRGGMNRYSADYDRGFKSREQTDAGDPFGDRPNHTPIRVTGGSRGSLNRYDNGYGRDRDWF
jgi:hypothetical protein